MFFQAYVSCMKKKVQVIFAGLQLSSQVASNRFNESNPAQNVGTSAEEMMEEHIAADAGI